MKFIYIFLFGIIAISAFAQRTITESEDMRFQAQIAQDTAALKNLLTDDLMYIHSNGLTETKSDFLHSITTGNITYKTMQPEAGRAIRTYGKTGISNGIVHATGLLNGNPFDIKLRYTAVYVKQRGKWRLASWQSTRVG